MTMIRVPLLLATVVLGLCGTCLLGGPAPVAALVLLSSPSLNSAFLGRHPHSSTFITWTERIDASVHRSRTFVPRSFLVMRKQKAGNKHTRRRQRGLQDDTMVETSSVSTTTTTTLTQSPMQQRGSWKEKTVSSPSPSLVESSAKGGRGRSRKRSNLYSSLSFYHDKFLNLLTHEYKAEEQEVIGRIEASIDDPLGLERAGHALFDMYPTRRGSLFTDEVYRLVKAKDATSTFVSSSLKKDSRNNKRENSTAMEDIVSSLPPNHKFSVNDVIVITRQPKGSGDLFDPSALPISETAQKMEARILSVGPTYVDIVVSAGLFEASLGGLAPNDVSGQGDRRMRVRADRFFSPIPYQRMVTALAQISQVPPSSLPNLKGDPKDEAASNPLDRISVDEVIRELVIGTHAFGDPDSPFYQDSSACNLEELSNRLSKPPMASSSKLASAVIKHIQSNPKKFRALNAPQVAAIQAALTRRCTLLQGPPGTGKTTVASAISFGFVHQCRSLSPHTKVLACAFSNVGADNLAEAIQRLGLKIVRIGKPSAVSQSLWNCTVDAAIDRDPDAQKALQKAAQATATLAKIRRAKSTTGGDDRMVRQAATTAVKASIQACNLAATKAFREADIIVSTSIGAADPRLMAACGLYEETDDGEEKKTSVLPHRSAAPDGLPPLSMPFVIVDEACQSVEPATLVPTISSNSCRSLVLLGDPCQLPPTVRHTSSTESPLSISLMERLATVLPHPNIIPKAESTLYETSFLEARPVRQARSLLHSRQRDNQKLSYRKRFAGSFMLSVQYRMHPSIASFPSGIFYDGLLSTPQGLAGPAPGVANILDDLLPSECETGNVRVVQVGTRSGEQRGSGVEQLPGDQDNSYSNPAEAEHVVDLIKGILRSSQRGDVKSIAVVSPYNGQVQLINNLLSSNTDLLDLINDDNAALIEVKSVDSFQGRERDVVIFSAVRSNREGKIGFLKDWRRLNVALTRAKKGLVVIGDFDTLAPADANWAAFQAWAVGSNFLLQGPNEA